MDDKRIKEGLPEKVDIQIKVKHLLKAKRYEDHNDCAFALATKEAFNIPDVSVGVQGISIYPNSNHQGFNYWCDEKGYPHTQYEEDLKMAKENKHSPDLVLTIVTAHFDPGI